jgi:hypothetical protein
MFADFANTDAATLSGAAVAWLLGLVILAAYGKAFFNYLTKGR